MTSVKCPECGVDVEICNDDGHGAEEGVLFEEECGGCGKTFGFTSSISFYYDAYKLPCANGEDHKLIDLTIFPKELGVGKKKCIYCDQEFTIDKVAHKKAVEGYFKELESARNKA